MSSSRSTLSVTLVPIASVHKLKAQIATLLNHIQHWMHKSIAEVEDQIENGIAQKTEPQMLIVHQRLDAFELRVLDQPALLLT